MPPRVKVLRAHRCCSSKSCGDQCKNNPRVILRPFLADFSSKNRYRFTSTPASASLFNKPEMSDIKLKVGCDFYYAHRLILSATSDVFANMLGANWLESNAQELQLDEEEECVKVFDRFLYYIYAGNIVLSESYVIPLFMLADKYNVKSLYDECIKVIKNGLKVFMTCKSGSKHLAEDNEMASIDAPGTSFQIASSGHSSSSDSSDFSESENSPTPLDQVPLQHVPSNDSPPPSPSKASTSKTILVASETFSLTLVMKMLTFCNNDSITNAALHNLEARLGNQISQGNFSVWNDLNKDLLTTILADNFFYCNEYHLFQATRSWLSCHGEAMASDVLLHIRFPILSSCELYKVDRDTLVKSTPPIAAAVQEAIRFQLFKSCCFGDDLEEWKGPSYQERQIRPH